MRVPLSLFLHLRLYRVLYLHLSQREQLLLRFLKSQDYKNNDYSYSHIDTYVPVLRYHSCLSKWMKRDDLYHSSYPKLFISIKNLYNARDWLGWDICDSDIPLRHGKIFRGSCLDNITSEEKACLLNHYHISAELDLRGAPQSPPKSPLGESVMYGVVRLHPYLYGVRQQASGYRTAFRFIMQALLDGRNIYVHCAGGADRTGCLFFLIGAALGFSESNLCKDYELSSFSSYGIRKRCFNADNSIFPFCDMIEHIKNTYSGTFQAKVKDWWAESDTLEPGITETEWELFKQLLT